MASSSSSPSVIIVGAGMSGISAAKTLHDAGINDFLILEATERIVGRMYMANFAGYTVEMGANWIHGVGGPKKNPLYEMAKQIHLKTFFSDFSHISLNTYKQEGGLYTKEEVEAAFLTTLATEEYGSEFSKRLDDTDDMSILDLQRLYKTVPKTVLERAINFMYFDIRNSEPGRVTSLKHSIPGDYAKDFGEDFYFVADPRGYESLVHLIAQQFLSYKNGFVDDSRLKFNQVVREVDQSKDGLVTVTMEDGKSYQAKLVILSPSLGVLQSDLISFKPTLPLWKTRAVSEFSIGIYTKIFLKFPRKFWPTGNGTEYFLYVHERIGYYTCWQHLENEYPGSNILIVTVIDDESIRVEQQSNEETRLEAMDVLRKMFGKSIPEATDKMIPRWKSDRFYQGSYSNWPARYPQQFHDQMRAPVDRVYFTGEHTHPKYFGYADGAYYAGIDTANDVIKCLKHTRFCGYKRAGSYGI